jgi:membrane-associated phospholipid phosphatase
VVVRTIFHRRFLQSFLVLSLLVWLRAWQRERRARPALEAARVALSPALGVLRDFVPFLIALIFYERLHDLTPWVRKQLVDDSLIAIDRALFHVDVSVWMGTFARPWLTQVMVVCYLSYFFAAAILACLIYWDGKRQLFRDYLVSLTVATLLGYVGYLCVPAVGPFVFQHDLFPERLPGGGLEITELVIRTLDQMKDFARDCFPSLHTTHTTVVLVFAWRWSRRAFFAYLPMALGLYVSTMYLRMHYAVDVAAGFATAAIAVWAGPRIERWWFEVPVTSSAPASR